MEDFIVAMTPDGRMGVHKWGSSIYYVPGDEDGFQWNYSRNERLSPMSYNAFGNDAYNARCCYNNWLEAAKEAASKLIK